MHRLTVVCILSIALFISSSSAICSNIAQEAEDPNYWTLERMASAISRDYLLDESNYTKLVTIQSRNLGAPCSLNAQRITTTSVYTTYPYNAVGKVFFTMGGNYVCSGSIAAGRTIWTAGHCVYDEIAKKFATNFIFVPGYYNAVEPYGRFTATSLCTTTQWANKGDFAYDYAVARFGVNLPSSIRPLELAVNLNVNNITYKSFGYPAGTPFNGYWENTCESGVCARDNGVTPPTLSIACDSTGGSSGGPWISENRFFVGLNSYGYRNIKDRMYGPYLDTATLSFFNTNKQ